MISLYVVCFLALPWVRLYSFSVSFFRKRNRVPCFLLTIIFERLIDIHVCLPISFLSFLFFCKLSTILNVFITVVCPFYMLIHVHANLSP